MNRIDSFDGTDAEYTLYLAANLTECRKQILKLGAPVPHPIQTRRSGAIDDEGLRVVFYDAPPSRPSFRPLGTPEETLPKIREKSWPREVRLFLDSVPQAQSWLERRKQLCMALAEENRSVIETLTDGPQEEASMTFQYMAGRSRPQTFANAGDEVIQRASDYAMHTKGVQMCEEFATLFGRFRNLILVTLCTVLLRTERLKISEKRVNNIMRICISGSSADYLRRIRNGCILPNQIAAKLLDTDWKSRTWELFLICTQQSVPFQEMLMAHRCPISAII